VREVEREIKNDPRNTTKYHEQNFAFVRVVSWIDGFHRASLPSAEEQLESCL